MHAIGSNSFADRGDADPLSGPTVSGMIHPFIGFDDAVVRAQGWLEDPEY